ncbi:ATP-binding protein [Dactylosporangium siamense]|uniref:ATP-binding protein n=1 Tax=Dactylosporangium siamense TaxID=685454 RepID=UPI00361CF38B
MSEVEGSRAFGALVRAHRRRLGLTQEELATKAGLSVRSIVKLEGGRIAVPRPPTVRLLADVFGLTGTDADTFRRSAAGVDAGEVTAGDPAPAAGRVPAQLPPDVSTFTGRAVQLAALDAMAAEAADQPTAVFVAVVTGPAGAGKTALAVRWAHHVRDRFPGGQLYVNLRGHDPAQPMATTEALGRFLAALGVAPPDVPVDADERAARFRTEIADRRVLLLLDNASSAEQVRPLLPGTGSCTALVTSRDTLPGLVAVDGAHRVEVDLLPPGDAGALLRRLIGARGRAEPGAVTTLAEQCARLPLALRVAAELVVARSGATLADLVAELDDQRQRLALLAAGDDPRASVSAVLSWSVRHLPPAAARTFGLLGLHPGADFDAHSIASLTGDTPAQARAVLDQLARAHLVHRTAPGRYGMHDLLRAYAAEHTQRPTDAPRSRLYDYYLTTAAAATDLLFPTDSTRRPQPPRSEDAPPPARGGVRPSMAPPGAALSDRDGGGLFDGDGDGDDGAALRAGVALSAGDGGIAVGAGGALSGGDGGAGSLDGGGGAVFGADVGLSGEDGGFPLRADAASSGGGDGAGLRAGAGSLDGGVGLRAGGGLLDGDRGSADGDRPFAVAVGSPSPVLVDAAAAHRWLDGERVALLAIVAETATGGWPGHAVRLSAILLRYLAAGQPADAVAVHGHGLDAALGLGDRGGEADTRTALGAALLRLGRPEPAAGHLERAVALHGELGNLAGEARATINLGLAAADLHRLPSAAGCFEAAARLYRRGGDRVGEARALNNLGLVEERMGRYGPAGEHHRRALILYREAGSLLGEASALTDLGIVEHRLGRHEEAAEQHRRALALFLDGHDRIGEAWARNGLGEAARSLGDPAGALTHHAAALAAATVADARDQQARAHRGLGDAHAALHDLARAGVHHEQAIALYAALGMPEADDLRAAIPT